MKIQSNSYRNNFQPTQYSGSKLLFATTLTPRRSLSFNSFQVLILILFLIFLLIGSVFINFGAWPVFSFLGLEIFLIWGAFHLNYYAACEKEVIRVYSNEIYVSNISATGKVSEFKFNPRWVRLIVERLNDDEIRQIKLICGGKGCLIGRFLNSEDLETFAAALENAINLAKK